MSISRSIVRAVRSLDPPGRFLDKDTVTGLWHDIGHKKAVEKTSQALRDGAAMLRKQLSADLGDPNFLNAVFSDDINKTKTCDNTKKKDREKNTIKINGKENNKEVKGNSSEKAKAIKVGYINTVERYHMQYTFFKGVHIWNSLSYSSISTICNTTLYYLYKYYTGKNPPGEKRASTCKIKSFCVGYCNE